MQPTIFGSKIKKRRIGNFKQIKKYKIKRRLNVVTYKI